MPARDAASRSVHRCRAGGAPRVLPPHVDASLHLRLHRPVRTRQSLRRHLDVVAEPVATSVPAVGAVVDIPAVARAGWPREVPVRAGIANLPEQNRGEQDVPAHSVCESGSGKSGSSRGDPAKKCLQKLWADHVIEHAAHFPAIDTATKDGTMRLTVIIALVALICAPTPIAAINPSPSSSPAPSPSGASPRHLIRFANARTFSYPRWTDRPYPSPSQSTARGALTPAACAPRRATPARRRARALKRRRRATEAAALEPRLKRRIATRRCALHPRAPPSPAPPATSRSPPSSR